MGAGKLIYTNHNISIQFTNIWWMIRIIRNFCNTMLLFNSVLTWTILGVASVVAGVTPDRFKSVTLVEGLGKVEKNFGLA